MLREINDIDGMQFGLMQGKITMDAILIVRQIQEKQQPRCVERGRLPAERRTRNQLSPCSNPPFATVSNASLTLWRIYGEWAYECSSP